MPASESQQWSHGASERILILVTADPSSAMVIRRAKRVADYLHADCMAVAIQQSPPAATRSPQRNARPIERHLNFARNLHIDARLLDAEPSATIPRKALVEFARVNGVTQIFLARPRGSGINGHAARRVWNSGSCGLAAICR